MKRHDNERRIALVCAGAMALCVLFAALGCNGIDADGATFAWQSPTYGIGMLPGPQQNYLTPEVVDVSAAHMLDGFRTLGIGVPYRLDFDVESVRLDVRPEPWPCPQPGAPGATCEGQQLDFKLMLATQPCVWRTAFMHELTHLLLAEATGNADPDHARTDVWPLTGDLLGPCP